MKNILSFWDENIVNLKMRKMKEVLSFWDLVVNFKMRKMKKMISFWDLVVRFKMRKMKKMFSSWDALIINFQEDEKNEENAFLSRWKHYQFEDEKNEENAFLFKGTHCPLQDMRMLSSQKLFIFFIFLILTGTTKSLTSSCEKWTKWNLFEEKSNKLLCGETCQRRNIIILRAFRNALPICICCYATNCY